MVTASKLSIFVPPVRRSTTAAKTSSSTRTTTTTKTTTRAVTQTRTTSYAKPAPPPRRDVYTEVGARDGVPALPIPPECAPVVQGPGTDSAAPPGNTHNSAVPTTITPPASSGTPSGTNTPLPPTQPACIPSFAIYMLSTAPMCAGALHSGAGSGAGVAGLLNDSLQQILGIRLPPVPFLDDLANFSDSLQSDFNAFLQTPLGQAWVISDSITEKIIPSAGGGSSELINDLLGFPRLTATAATPMTLGEELTCLAAFLGCLLQDSPTGNITGARAELGLEIGLTIGTRRPGTGRQIATGARQTTAAMDSFLASGATVRHSGTATAIGDDASTLINFERSIGADGYHDVILHGTSGGRPIVNKNVTHVQQIADAITSNPRYTAGCSIRLVMCHGGREAAAQLSEILNVEVLASMRKVQLHPLTGRLVQAGD